MLAVLITFYKYLGNAFNTDGTEEYVILTCAVDLSNSLSVKCSEHILVWVLGSVYLSLLHFSTVNDVGDQKEFWK